MRWFGKSPFPSRILSLIPQTFPLNIWTLLFSYSFISLYNMSKICLQSPPPTTPPKNNKNLSVLPCLRAFAPTALLWKHSFSIWPSTCPSGLWYSYPQKEPLLVPRSPQPLVTCPRSAVHTNMPGTFPHHSILHNWTVTSGKLICMILPPKLSPLGQELCLVCSGTPSIWHRDFTYSGDPINVYWKSNESMRTFSLSLYCAYTLRSGTTLSSILLFPLGSCPTGAGCFPSLGWEQSSWRCQELSCIPGMNLVWPNVRRADHRGVWPQGIQRRV